VSEEKRLRDYWAALEANARNVSHTDRDTKPQPRKGPIPVYHFAADNQEYNNEPIERLEDDSLAWWTSADFERSFRDRYNAIVRVTTTFMSLLDVIEAHTGAPAPQEGDAPYNPYTDDAMFSEDERSALPREPSQRRTLYLAALMDVAAQEKVIPPFSLQGNVLQEREDFRALLASGLDPLPMPTRGWFVRQIVPQSVVELFVFDDTALNDLA